MTRPVRWWWLQTAHQKGPERGETDCLSVTALAAQLSSDAHTVSTSLPQHSESLSVETILSFLSHHKDQIADNIWLKIMWIAKMSLKSDFISKEDPTKLAALQGDTNLLLELLEDGAPFIVDSVRSQSDRILYWICLIGLDLFLSLSFSSINCL